MLTELCHKVIRSIIRIFRGNEASFVRSRAKKAFYLGPLVIRRWNYEVKNLI